MALRVSDLRVSNMLCVLAFLLVMSSAASAVSIDRMDVSVPNSIDAGESFDVDITFKDPTENETVEVDIEITVDGLLVHEEEDRSIDLREGVDKTITIKSSDFDTDNGDIWDDNLMAYKCADNLEVEVMVSGDLDETESDDMDIEADGDRELSFEIDPDPFSLDDTITITVYDEDDDELKSASVKFTWIDDEDGDTLDEWDVEDKYETEKTDSNGEADFKLYRDFDDNAYGKYQLDLWMDGYCKLTETYDLRNVLNVSDPMPESPKVGEQFKLKITTPSGKAATGVWAYLNPGGFKSRVTMDGEVSFTVTAAGTYSLAVGGTGSGYQETIKTIKVSTKPQLTATVSPDPQNVNKAVLITIQSDGKAVSGASVKVMRAGGTEQSLPGVTSDAGTISFTPTVAGDYTVKASKSGYDDVTEAFTIQDSFQIDMPTEELKRGSQVTLTVKDSSGDTVSGASVSIEGTSISGMTDAAGHFSFTLDEVGEYYVVVRKSGFAGAREELTAKGKLSLKLDKKELTLGESVKMTVVDSEGALTESSIKVTGPAGAETFTASELDYKPSKAGEHTVEASKSGYAKASDTLNVKPKPLTLTYHFKDGNLLMNASTNNEPVAGITLKVTAGETTYNVKTDDAGVASVVANLTGNYTIEVTNPDYTGAKVTAEKSSSLISPDLILPIIVVLVVLVLIVIFVIVAVGLLHKGRKSKGSFGRSPGSRLGG
ncbi:MAG: hypothetical protein GF416_08355 [Candidatus Altiarchaeales archaeon]|nr:hypothetical protein [Candidatus Altiarchaeales archaeon]MBD3417126.1 hypothetical protein [Candidatus Altiarchaeales archaeon]